MAQKKRKRRRIYCPNCDRFRAFNVFHVGFGDGSGVRYQCRKCEQYITGYEPVNEEVPAGWDERWDEEPK